MRGGMCSGMHGRMCSGTRGGMRGGMCGGMRGGLCLRARVAAALRFFLFERVFRKSVCNEICKESRGTVDFAVVRGCLILGARMAAALESRLSKSPC